MSKLILFFKCTVLVVLVLTNQLFAQQSSSPVLWENFETGTKGSYAAADILLSTGSWFFSDALIGTLANDRKNGLRSARIQQAGEIRMNFDLSNGIDTLRLLHAKFGTDANSTWRLQVSNNGGLTWDAFQSSAIETNSTSLTEQKFFVNLPGNLRFRILKLSGGSARINIDDISISPFTGVPTPIINTNLSSISGLNYHEGFGPSSESNFTVSGSFLTSDIVLTAPSNFEISTVSGSGFTNSITLSHSMGTVSSTDIFVRLKSNLLPGTYNQTLLINSQSANQVGVILSGTVIGSPISYTWIGGTGTFSSPANWTPTRTVEADNDILVFNSNATVDLDFTASKNIGKLLIQNGAQVEFNASGSAKNINIGFENVLSPNLEILTGSLLLLNSTTAINLSLAAGYTANINGTIEFRAGAHRLTSTDIGSVNFNSGSTFETGLNFSGSPFGTTNLNSVNFKNNSSYIHRAGTNPFGASAPNSVVVFESGSTFIARTTTGVAISGRTYSNFTLDITSGSLTATGSSSFIANNLVLLSGNLNLNLTGNPGHSIIGNVFVAANTTLNFAPTSASVINFNGTTTQTFSGPGNITSGTNSSFVFQNNVVTERNLVFNNLEIQSGRTFIVNPLKQITINGSFINNGVFTLSSDNTGTATLLANNISGTGTFNMQQFLTGTNNGLFPNGRMWYITSPVSNATSGVFNVASSINRLWSHSEANQVNLTSGYTQILDNSTVLNPGVGYVVRLGGDTTVQFSSTTLNSGNYNYSLTRTGSTHDKRGYHLLGNPYPSFLNPISTMTNPANNLNPSVWYRTSTGSAMTFETYNYQTQVGTSGLSQHIPPMQGFWVQVSGDGNTGTFALDNTMRSHQNNMQLRSSLNNNVARIYINNSINSDEAIVLFNSSAGGGLDNWDSQKMHNNNPNISEVYSKENNVNLVINCMPQITNGMIVPLYINVGQSLPHVISANLNNFDTTTSILLHDLQTNIVHDLRTGTYNFTSNIVNDFNRFNLIFNNIITNTEIVNNEHTNIFSFENNIYINSLQEGIVEVFDVLGKRVATKNINPGLNNIIVDTKGVYIVRYTSSKETKAIKVKIW